MSEPAAPVQGPWRSQRLVVVALATALTWSTCHALGIGDGAPYGVVLAAVIVRPDFDRWPPPIFVLVPVVVGLGLSLGTALRPLLEAPPVWQFAAVTVCAQVLAQTLPDKLLLARNLIAVTAVLPLLGSSATWLDVWHKVLAVVIGIAFGAGVQGLLRLPSDPLPVPREVAMPHRSIEDRFADRFFWRKLIVSALALSIGMGLGTLNPKYLYFGVVLLLNDSLGATLGRVRDRMIGVSLGVLMPWLVFNTFGVNDVAVGMTMGGTTALLEMLWLRAHLRTALISSGVTYAGYGVLTDWYVPSRWIDYLLGCGLALLVCLAFERTSALGRFRALVGAPATAAGAAEMARLLPNALEEARWLGQEANFRALLAQQQSATGAPQSEG
ncbi:MAG: FUSC family protein [Cyanobium sp.]